MKTKNIFMPHINNIYWTIQAESTQRGVAAAAQRNEKKVK